MRHFRPSTSLLYTLPTRCATLTARTWAPCSWRLNTVMNAGAAPLKISPTNATVSELATISVMVTRYADGTAVRRESSNVLFRSIILSIIQCSCSDCRSKSPWLLENECACRDSCRSSHQRRVPVHTPSARPSLAWPLGRVGGPPVRPVSFNGVSIAVEPHTLLQCACGSFLYIPRLRWVL